MTPLTGTHLAPVEERVPLPELIEMLLHFLLHQRLLSVGQDDHGYRVSIGAESFKELIEQVQSLFTPAQDQNVISIPNAAFCLGPVVHARPDPLHLSST